MKSKNSIFEKKVAQRPLSKEAMKTIKGGNRWQPCYTKRGDLYWVYTIYTCPNPAP
jgi:hypothetical protein